MLLPDGRPASDVEVTVGLNVGGGSTPIAADVTGRRFEVWLPVGKIKAYSLWIRAASRDGSQTAYAKLGMYELRQRAIDGITLTLAAPTRDVEVEVVEYGQPVAEATVVADLGYGIELRSRTDADGLARFQLPPDQELERLTVWTDDCRVGGYSFDGGPQRDPHANRQQVELSRCRDQTLRFIDPAGATVPGVDFQLQIATPPPNYNYIGTNDHSRLTTDEAGEAVYRWFPDSKEHHFYAELLTDQWILDDETQQDGDVYVFPLKPSRIADRKSVEGRVVSDETDCAGFCVRFSRSRASRNTIRTCCWRSQTRREGSLSTSCPTRRTTPMRSTADGSAK